MENHNNNIVQIQMYMFLMIKFISWISHSVSIAVLTSVLIYIAEYVSEHESECVSLLINSTTLPSTHPIIHIQICRIPGVNWYLIQSINQSINQSTKQSTNQFNSNLTAREPDSKWYAVEIIAILVIRSH